MAEKRILPLGFIDRTTGDGAIIMLTRPSESHTIWPETPVTLQSRSAGEPRATASARGMITLVGYVTATCKIVETRMDSGWLSRAIGCWASGVSQKCTTGTMRKD